MPGSLLRGYLQAQQYTQQQEELTEEKKREKLQEALNQLDLQRGRRTIERESKEWEYQERKRAELDEALANLRLRGVDIDALIAGYEVPEAKEPPYKWMGTPYEKVGARKQFHISPGDFEGDAYERRLLEADPEDLTEGQERYLRGVGYRYDSTLESWVKPEKGERIGGKRTPEELAKLIETFTPEIGADPTGLEPFADSLRNLAAERLRGEEFPQKLRVPTGTGMGEYARGIPEISLPGQPPSEEETFHGAESYEEVVEAVANIPEPKRSEILEEAKEFFGIE